MFFEPHYQAIHSPADDLRGLDPQALTRLFKRSNGMVRYEKQNGREEERERYWNWIGTDTFHSAD